MLPPISLYELLNDYYVLDGHHRVGAAREIGMTYLDADVVQFLPDEDSPARQLSQERGRFELLTGLRDIELRDPGAYPGLQTEIDEHKWILGEAGDGEVALKVAARSWFLRRASASRMPEPGSTISSKVAKPLFGHRAHCMRLPSQYTETKGGGCLYAP